MYTQYFFTIFAEINHICEAKKNLNTFCEIQTQL